MYEYYYCFITCYKNKMYECIAFRSKCHTIILSIHTAIAY